MCEHGGQLFTHEVPRYNQPESVKFAEFHFTAPMTVFRTLH